MDAAGALDAPHEGSFHWPFPAPDHRRTSPVSHSAHAVSLCREIAETYAVGASERRRLAKLGAGVLRPEESNFSIKNSTHGNHLHVTQS